MYQKIVHIIYKELITYIRIYYILIAYSTLEVLSHRSVRAMCQKIAFRGLQAGEKLL